TTTPISLASLASSLKKNSVSTINSNLITQLTSSNTGSVQGIPISSHDHLQSNQDHYLLPLKDREYDAEIHCGVLIIDTGKPCTRSLTCKTHSLTLRRAVHGRSKKFDELLIEHKAAKEAQMKASKPPEAAANMIQSTPPRGSVGLNNTSSIGQLNGPSAYVASNVGTSSTSSTSLFVRTLGGGTQTTHVTVPYPDPSPNSTTHYYSMDPPSTSSHSQTTPPSPAYWTSQRPAPPLSHSDNFFVGESPKPLAVCSYNARRLGGYLSTDHKVDALRSAFANALRKPHMGSNSDNSVSNNIIFNNNIERFNNVKPLLARKLQAAIPSNPNVNKEGIGVGVGYNGHIQLNSSNGVAIHNSTLTASLKRQTHPDLLRQNSTVVNTKSKSKKVKSNDSTINYVSNVVQLDASGSKNHFPVVAVSLQNGLTNPHTITFGNVPIAGVRNSNHALKLHQPITVRDAQVTDPRTSSGDGANFVLGSSLPSGGITAGNSAGGINIVGSPSALGSGTSTVSTSTLPHQGQVYFTAVSGSNNTQLLQQLLNCRTIGKNTGVKLLGTTSQGTVTGNRQTFVLQQEKEPS
ncbi:Ataxin-7, partial [Armadillidium nasatum]